MLNAKEELKTEKEYPVLPSYKSQTDSVLPLTQSCTNSAAAPTTTTITTDIPQKAGKTVHEKHTETSDHGNGGNGLWEPCILDSFVPPDTGSSVEFPSLMQSNPALKKKW